jgi:hypothetical protein
MKRRALLPWVGLCGSTLGRWLPFLCFVSLGKQRNEDATAANVFRFIGRAEIYLFASLATGLLLLATIKLHIVDW